jgi:Fic family protein
MGAFMRVTDKRYYEAFIEELGIDINEAFSAIDFTDERVDLGYRIKSSAVFSANIEGNSVDLSAFMNSIISKEPFKPRKEIQEIKDLVEAYEFAKDHELTAQNFLEAHRILSPTILIKDKRGVYRNDKMGVFDSTGLVYLAIEPQFVPAKMEELFQDIQALLKRDLSITEAFYHASLIHLKFVHIHPFWDGNGRSARLLEKWFLSKQINGRAWKIQSEKYYKEHLAHYYDTINLGVNYYELNYDRCLPFLTLLPASLQQDL